MSLPATALSATALCHRFAFLSNIFDSAENRWKVPSVFGRSVWRAGKRSAKVVPDVSEAYEESQDVGGRIRREFPWAFLSEDGEELDLSYHQMCHFFQAHKEDSKKEKDASFWKKIFGTTVDDSLSSFLTSDVLVSSEKRLEALPSWIGHHKKLKYVNVSGQKLRELPPSFLGLERIEALILSNNALEHVPDVVKDWPHLRRLDLSFNRIGVFPAWFPELSERLESCDTSFNVKSASCKAGSLSLGSIFAKF